MTILHRISLILLLATVPLYPSHQNSQETSNQEISKKTSFKKQIKVLYKETIQDLQDLSEIKKTISKAELQPAIQSVDRFLCELKNFLYNLYAYLSQSTPSEHDKQYVKRQYLQFKYLFKEDTHDKQLMAHQQYAQQQKYNLELLKNYYALEQKQQAQGNQKPNLGNWIRNTKFLQSQPVKNRAALDAIKHYNDSISQNSYKNAQ